MTTLVGCTELAFWYHQEGEHRGAWSSFDRVWAVADRVGAPLGSVEFDAGLGAPTYRLRDAAGAPLLALAHGGGLLASNDSPLHILWPDGTTVATFSSPEVWWGQQAIGKWLVQMDLLEGGVGVFGGAWLWDTHDAVVASVTQVKDPATGSHFVLSRSPGLDELLGWATLALPLAVHQKLFEREVQDARGGGRRNDRTDLL